MKYIATLIAFFLLSTPALGGMFAAPEEKVEAAVYLWHLINECRVHPLDTIRSLGIDENAARQALGPDSWILDEGLPPLAWNNLLATSAGAHNHDMLDKSYYDKMGLDGSTPAERVVQTGYNAIDVRELLGLLAFPGVVDRFEAARIIFENWVRDECNPLRPSDRCIFNPDLTELGLNFIAATVDLGSDTPSNIYVVVGDFAIPVEQRAFIVGDVYHDSNGNKKADLEEFVSGVDIILSRLSTGDSVVYEAGVLGAYQIERPIDIYTITVTDGAGNVLARYAGFGGEGNCLMDLRIR